MLRDSRTSLHFGVSFVFAPQPVLDTRHRIGFLGALAEEGLEFPQTNSQQRALLLKRPTPPLEVRILQPGPPVGQLLLLAPHPARTLDDFIAETQDVGQAFSKTWPGELQIVQRDCTIRHLYDVAADHAFQYLWERRLHGVSDEIKAFKRPVLGGGLRFVMPAQPGQPDSPNIEVRVESYLHDSKKLFVEVQMAWIPQMKTQSLDAALMLHECERFATTEVVAFIEGAHHE